MVNGTDSEILGSSNSVTQPNSKDRSSYDRSPPAAQTTLPIDRVQDPRVELGEQAIAYGERLMGQDKASHPQSSNKQGPLTDTIIQFQSSAEYASHNNCWQQYTAVNPDVLRSIFMTC